jgi:uncharacterized membrane protein
MARRTDRNTAGQTEQNVNRKGIKGLLKTALRRYFIDAMGAMALGLFASLIIGLILKQIFSYIPVGRFQAVVDAIVADTSAKSP